MEEGRRDEVTSASGCFLQLVNMISMLSKLTPHQLVTIFILSPLVCLIPVKHWRTQQVFFWQKLDRTGSCFQTVDRTACIAPWWVCLHCLLHTAPSQLCLGSLLARCSVAVVQKQCTQVHCSDGVQHLSLIVSTFCLSNAVTLKSFFLHSLCLHVLNGWLSQDGYFCSSLMLFLLSWVLLIWCHH